MSVAVSNSINTNSATLKKLFIKEGELLVRIFYIILNS